MNRTDILSQLSCAPLLIEEPFGHAFIASMAALPEKLDYFSDEEGIDNTRCYPVVNGVAVIPIIGTLMHRPSWSYYYRNAPNYLSLADMIEDAVTDSNIKAVLLEVDSHGGLASGCLDLAESIRSMRGIKPMWASVNQSACSAAYALASSADRIEIAKSAKAGSIGVMAVHWDYSAALEKWGEKVTYLYAGKHKIDGVPTSPLTDQARKEFMDSIEAEYQRICEVTAAGRGVDVKKMMETEAGVFRGQAAVDAGLADAVATFEETMMAITKKTAPNGARLSSGANLGSGESEEDKNMTTTAPNENALESGVTLSAPVLAEASSIAEACQAAGYPHLTSTLINAKPTMEAVTARLDEAREIDTAAKAVGLEAMSANLIASGVNLETARKLLFDAKAGADGKLNTSTVHANDAPNSQTSKIDVHATYNAFNNVKA